MTLSDAVSKCLSNYFTFSGRASRSEYWWFTLFNFVSTFILILIFPIAGLIMMIGLIAPSWAVACRRLHDTNKSGWMVLISLIPIVGLIVLYWFCQSGDKGQNQYGLPA